MDSFQKCVLALIANALSIDRELEDNYRIPWEKLYIFSKKQKISSLILFAVKKLELAAPNKFIKLMETDVLQQAMLFEQQKYELNKVEEAFNNAGIDYMLLKGLNVNKYYSENFVRMMKDLDILIKLEQYESIKKVLNELGFRELKETCHEIVWKKGNVVIELHKYIESPYNKDYFEYFNDGWSFAKRYENTCAHYLNKEDEFVYLLTHFAGHYRNSGIDILHFLDLWMYLCNSDVDLNNIETKLKKLELYQFYNNVTKTLKVWFENGEEDEVSKLITNHLFTKGTNEAYSFAQISGEARSLRFSKSKKSSKIKVVIHALFPSFEKIRYRNPILNKAPYLLPVVWVVRWFELLGNPQKLKTGNQRIKGINQENIKDYLSELDMVGLDFKK